MTFKRKSLLPVTAREIRDTTRLAILESIHLIMEALRDPLLADFDPDKARADLFRASTALASISDKHDKLDILQYMRVHPESTVAEKIKNLNTNMLQGVITPEVCGQACDLLEKELSPQRVDMLREFIDSQHGTNLAENSSLSGELPSRLVN